MATIYLVAIPKRHSAAVGCKNDRRRSRSKMMLNILHEYASAHFLPAALPDHFFARPRCERVLGRQLFKNRQGK
jgi:hypothetical protein